MQNIDECNVVSLQRAPWNKGKLVGQKPPLAPKHVWAIRTRLQLAKRRRDLALFNLAIDSKLRACDLVSLRVEDVAPHGYAIERATVRQKKTGRPVRFELTEQTRQAIDAYVSHSFRKPGDRLFLGRSEQQCLTTRQYARLVSDWISSIGFGFLTVRDSLVAPYQGDTDLPSHRQSSCSATSARTHKDREHRQILGHRGG